MNYRIAFALLGLGSAVFAQSNGMPRYVKLLPKTYFTKPATTVTPNRQAAPTGPCAAVKTMAVDPTIDLGIIAKASPKKTAPMPAYAGTPACAPQSK